MHIRYESCNCFLDMNIDPEKFTELGIAAIQEMAEVAKRNGQQEVEVWHLLTALMNQENGIVPALMDEMGVGTAPVQLALQREMQKLPKIAGNVNTARSYASAALTEAVEKDNKYPGRCRMITSARNIFCLAYPQLESPLLFNSFSKIFP